MNRIEKTLVLLCAVAPLLASDASAQSAATNKPALDAAPAMKAEDLFPDKVVAQGKGVSINQSRLDRGMLGIKAKIAASGQSLPPQELPILQRQVLDHLVTIDLLYGQATDDEKAAGKKAADEQAATIKKSLGSDDMFERQLKLMQLTPEQFMTESTKEATAETVMARLMKISVSDADAKKFYDDNPAYFEQPEMVRASHILLLTQDPATGQDLTADQKAAKRKQIDDLLKRARAGEDFAKLARDFSEDPGTKDNGGELKFARGQMVSEFEAAAFALQTNQISDVVTTKYGYHIIKLSERIPAHKAAFDEASAKIKDYLKQQAEQKRMPAFMLATEKDANLEILDNNLKSLDISTVYPQLDSASAPASVDKKP
jgi:peptidyl-prolyl cis-trans isomerase C